MAKNIYVGNLSWDTNEDELRDLFAQFGEVISAKIIFDRDTGRSKGFGFVEMNDSEADEAIQSLDGKDFMERNIRVNESRPKPRNDSRKRW